MNHIETGGRFSIGLMKRLVIVGVSGNIEFRTITSDKMVFPQKLMEGEFKIEFG
ncbi:MAG: hypothetical protein E6124_22945 [Blautia producta]|uniref:hypothetical protein n=1 Tax=Blautia producta TaxID=33035 RepID=UPI0029069313|nr:hypothetical protein [Blautia producta]MDU5385028.1 hypothetical protein [Blautia producta]MDU6885643.1 hypothetical protein [Blautia producta]